MIQISIQPSKKIEIINDIHIMIFILIIFLEKLISS